MCPLSHVHLPSEQTNVDEECGERILTFFLVPLWKIRGCSILNSLLNNYLLLFNVIRLEVVCLTNCACRSWFPISLTHIHFSFPLLILLFLISYYRIISLLAWPFTWSMHLFTLNSTETLSTSICSQHTHFLYSFSFNFALWRWI